MIQVIEAARVSDEQLQSVAASALSEYRLELDGLTSLQATLAAAQTEIAALRALYDSACIGAINDKAAATEAARLKQELAEAESRLRGLGLEIARSESRFAVAKNNFDTVARQQAQRRDQVEKRERWESIRIQCRTAKNNYARCVLDCKVAMKHHDEADHKVRLAQNALARAERSRLSWDNFPTDAELRQEAEAIRELQIALNKAFEERNLLPNVEVLRMAAVRAYGEFERLAWQEGNLRPANPRSR